MMDKDKNKDLGKKNKVIFIPQEDDELELENNDTEIAELLAAMRQMRRSIPVNYQLKADLRKQFVEMNQSNGKNSENPITSPRLAEVGRKERKVQMFQWLLLLVPFLAVIGAMFFFMSNLNIDKINNGGFHREEREILSSEWGFQNYSHSIGQNNVIYYINGGSLWKVDYHGQKKQKVFTPDAGEVLHWVTLAPKEDKLALIVEEYANYKLVTITLADKAQEVVYEAEDGQVLQQLSWAPNGAEIAFTKVTQDKSEIYLVELDNSSEIKKIAAGISPTWSPHGRQIAFQKINENGENEIWLYCKESEKQNFWGLGSQPHWSSNDQLAFIQERRWEKVLSYSSHGQPMLISEQTVQEVWAADLSGKIKVNLTNVPGPTPEEEAMQLREWERLGANEPVVWPLASSVADTHPRWTPDGKYLVIQRQQGNGSSLLWLKVGGLK